MMARSSRMLRSSSTTRTRVSGMARQGEGEGGAEAGRAAHVDLAAMLLDDPVNQREPEPRPLFLGREERLEEMGQIARRDAFARVTDRDLEALAANGGCDAELPPLRHRFDRVQAQIPENLTELLRVDRPHQGRRELTSHLETTGRGPVLEQE